MTKLEGDGVFELQIKRWTELVELRQALTGLKMDPAGVDVAFANVFDYEKGHIIDSMIMDSKELIAMILQLEELQIDSRNVKAILAKAFIPGSSGMFASDLVKMKEMIKMREHMSGMGIPTGCIEATIADVFKVNWVKHETGYLTDQTQPLSAPGEIFKPEEASEASVARQCSSTAETTEPAELDASATAILGRSTAELSKPAELEAPETALIPRPPWGTDAGKAVENSSRPTETMSVPKETEGDKPAEMSSQPLATEPLSLEAEHMTMIGTSIEAMGLDSFPPITSPPLTNASPVLTTTSTVHSTPSTKTASNSSSPSTSDSRLSAKRSAPVETELGSASNPICLGSSPTPKRQRTARNAQPKATLRTFDSWKVPIQFVGIMGLHLKPKDVETNMNIVFDQETHRIVFDHGQNSLTALYPDLEINPEALLSITRPKYSQSKDLKVRFMWLDTDAEETFLDIMVATKQKCRELIAKVKALTSFDEKLVSEPDMDRLFKDANWVVHETQNSVGVSVTRLSEKVLLG
ncbi:hypothetical protein IMSHALPRED_004649 [Imshaugia aleurites]|uniref:Uncharacterized protein n=1 Tax=Imshaugia aleurites TaxID=172621 RepID=A0A8H3F7G2_9LECA|nr:hypothetical protein IMSHALPRED_004649 [Imshaugia aleurites]